jgi:hypothetical protein
VRYGISDTLSGPTDQCVALRDSDLHELSKVYGW